MSGRVFCNLAQMFYILWTSEANELNKMATEDEDLSASVIVLSIFFWNGLVFRRALQRTTRLNIQIAVL